QAEDGIRDLTVTGVQTCALPIFRQKANCQACHGWAGDGRKMDEQMPDGANLRQTRLDRAALIMTIKCGLPGTGMPPFDRFAYSEIGRASCRERGEIRVDGGSE